MKTTKRMTFTLPLDDFKIIYEYSERMKLNKSNFISYSIEKCGFPLMEEELEDKKRLDYDTPYKRGKKFHNTHPITVTLPIDVVEKLNFYSKELGIKKSHLVSISLFLLGEKKQKELSDEIDDLMEIVKDNY